MSIKWWKLLFYCALLSISIVTEVVHPQAKQVFCTPLLFPSESPQVLSDREK